MSVASTLDGLRKLVASGHDHTHISITASRLAIAVLTVLFAVAAMVGVSAPLQAQMVVYLIGMVALNLPHGGYEHFTNLRRRRWRFRWRYLGLYLAVLVGFIGLYLAVPVIGLGLALVVAMAKGGIGDLHVLDVTTGTPHLRARWQRWLAVLVRGGAVMLVPIVFWPDTFHAFSSLMVALVDPGGLVPYTEYFDLTRPFIAIGYAVALTLHTISGYLQGGGQAWRVDAAEALLLSLYFAVVPVVVAVGLYFPFWYSARQTARHARVRHEPVGTDANDLLGPDPQTAALRAWGILIAGALATFVVLATVYWIFSNPLPGGLLAGGVAFWSIFISIIALPHVVVGSLLDGERGIWYVP